MIEDAPSPTAIRDEGLKRHILAHVTRENGGPIRAAELLHLGSRASVDQALSRMAKSGLLRRSGRGEYRATGATPSHAAAETGVAKRDAIVDAAAQLFAARGYYGVSMRDIAEPSGLHIATLYHYFPDKRAIYDAVVKAAWAEGARRTLQLGPSDLAPRRQLEAWIVNVLEFHFLESTSARIRDREIFSGDENGSPISADMLAASAQNEEAVAAMIERLSPPILQYMPAFRVASMIYALSYGIIKFRPAHAVIRPRRDDLELRTITADVVHFVGAALGWSEEA